MKFPVNGRLLVFRPSLKEQLPWTLQIIDPYHYFLCRVSYLKLTWETFYFIIYNSISYPLSDNQWGFTKGKSTTGALLAATDQWHQWLDAGLEICIIFLITFDTVPHWLLLVKLQSVCVHPHILRWIASYLCRRTQYVCVGGAASQSQPVTSGVTQGSMLGPLLFNFYINDISLLHLTAGTMSLYADDIMLYCIIHSQVDFFALQIDVDTLCVWTDEHCLNFNAIKCKYMVISRKWQPTLLSSPLAMQSCFI